MKILSVRQPWASLVASGVKDVENRTWRTTYRGPLLIHAALRADDISVAELLRYHGAFPPSDQPRGGIVGIAELVDCVRPHTSSWYARGCWAWCLANARRLPFTPWKGGLSLREAPAELLTRLGLAQDEHGDAPAASEA